MTRETLRSRAVLGAAGLYLIVSLVSSRLPLLNYLGYEFSFLIALLSSFVSGFLAIHISRRRLENDPESIAKHPARTAADVLSLNIALLIVPLAVMLINALIVKNCSLLEGAAFFLLLPFVSVVFSSALGLCCSVLFRWSKTAFVVMFLATIVEVIAVGYVTPAVFSYNPFFGYFPGLTYDEALGIGHSLVIYRGFTLVLAAAVLWITRLVLDTTDRKDPSWKKCVTVLGTMTQGRARIIAIAFVIVVAVIWWFRGELGFESSCRYIRNQLGRHYETAHFSIYYSPESYDDEEIRWIAGEHEFRLKQISDVLNLPVTGRIESYIYPSNQVKLRLIGAGNTNIAKPWSRQIHITKQSLDATLKHELVHVVVGRFGMPVIRASLSTGLVEGVAMAIEWDWGSRSLHRYAAAMRKFGVAPDISSLMTITGFASHSSSISYVLAGSFCRYLIDTYGIRDMTLLYGSNNYRNVYSKPLDELIREWYGYLDGITVTSQDRDAVDVLFRRPSIFRKVCARVLAARNIEAAAAFARKEYGSAARLFRQAFEDGRSYDALSGYVASALHNGDFDAVIAAFDTVMQTDPKPSQYLPLFINVGLAEFAKGDWMGAQGLFRRVETADVGKGLTETAAIYAAASLDSANRVSLVRYSISVASDTQRTVMLDSMLQDPEVHWVPIYLKGKALARLHRWEDCIHCMEQIDAIPEPRLEASRLETVGYALFRLRRFEDAKTSFWKALNYDTAETTGNEIADWIERCDWMKTASY